MFARKQSVSTEHGWFMGIVVAVGTVGKPGTVVKPGVVVIVVVVVVAGAK